MLRLDVGAFQPDSRRVCHQVHLRSRSRAGHRPSSAHHGLGSLELSQQRAL